jgi:uncharacterized iron-regulated membrane protein
MAKIWGLPYKIFVCLMGHIVTLLSVTGVYIWWKNPRARLTLCPEIVDTLKSLNTLFGLGENIAVIYVS